MKAVVMGLVGAILLASFVSAPLRAQTEVSCAQEYSVAAGDWLSTIAEKYLKSVKAYPAIMTQTNLKSQTDFSFATIVNLDSIEVGWKLCIPDQATADALNGANPPPGLDKNALYNATYSSELVPDGRVTVTNGSFSVESTPGAVTMTTLDLTGQIAYGDLNGTPSAAVVTGSSGGGTGFFYIISLMQAQDGKATEVATTGTGDRSPVLALVIENNQVMVDYLTQGPDQPMCCGNLRVVDTYALEGNKLNQTSHKELGYLGPNGETPGQPFTVSGQVIYREKIAMPEGAVVTVRVSDVSLADAPADVIGEQVIENPGNVPVKFSVAYDASKIQQGRTFAVSARIEVNGKLEWISTTRIPVITDGAPTSNVTVPVERVGGTANTTSADDAAKKLTDSVWQWQSTTQASGDMSVNDPTRYTITFNADGTANIKNDCNNILANYTLNGSNMKLELGPSTLVACSEDSRDTEFRAQLSAVSSYKIENEMLLLETADMGTMKFASGGQAAGGTGAIGEPLFGLWKWQGTQTPKEEIKADDPNKYTVNFKEDGFVEIKADCNTGQAAYGLGGTQELHVSPIALTKVFCGEQSQDTVFVSQFQNSAIYFFKDGDLYIDLTADAGTMRFAH